MVSVPFLLSGEKEEDMLDFTILSQDDLKGLLDIACAKKALDFAAAKGIGQHAGI